MCRFMTDIVCYNEFNRGTIENVPSNSINDGFIHTDKNKRGLI